MQGFPGVIELHRCIVSKNLVYIPEIFPSMRSQGFDFESNTIKAAIKVADLMKLEARKTIITD